MNNKLLIKELHLQSYRPFEDFKIDFDDQLTVLVAPNGKGKTAVLDAVAVAFGTFVNSTGMAKGTAFNRSDVRKIKVRETELNEMEAQYPLIMYCKGTINEQEIDWDRSFNSPKSATTIRNTRPLITYGEEINSFVKQGIENTIPLISYYGTGRLWGNKKLTKKKQNYSSSRLSGYVDCLDPLSSYKAFAEWFEYICKSEFEQKMEALESSKEVKDNEFTHMKKAVQNAVNIVLDKNCGWKNIVYKQKANTIVAEHEIEGELAVSLLSDGIRNMIGMVADIAYRATKLNPHLKDKAAEQTPGIVLIDEVDMHLHPKWQQTVLTDLIEAFPLIQFIVTTHSPQVLSTVKRYQIRILGMDGGVIPTSHTLGEKSSSLLSDIFGASPWPPLEIVKQLKEYLRLVEDKEYDSQNAKELRVVLEQNYGKNHEYLIEADMLIQRYEALKKFGKQ